MKHRINQLVFPVPEGYTYRCTLEYKKHWWSRWQYVMEDGYPQLFTKEQLKPYLTKNELKEIRK